jgi:hypothetical protein
LFPIIIDFDYNIFVLCTPIPLLQQQQQQHTTVFIPPTLLENMLTKIFTSLLFIQETLAFVSQNGGHLQRLSSSSSQLFLSSVPSDVSTTDSTLDELKSDLVRACTRSSGKPLLNEIKMLVADLEEKAEAQGIGQASSLTGILAGEW